ncbi:MAG: TIGR03936 family radical SAM-associated protein [Eggerthellaceae bacterium]|nr:TIGR03936 family radical SAM-associated protein [Eggerthellaceae bacterium]
MPEVRLFRLRVFFCKGGRLALLSHLELARALERTVRRAGLPYAVSQGFSPHMRIAFGAALPVGVGGLQECFDLSLASYVAPDKALEALVATSAEDLMPHTCNYIGSKAPAASVAYPLCAYEARFSRAPEAPLPVPETVTLTRKSKEKVLRVADYLEGEPVWDGDRLTFALWSRPTGSLRCDTLVEAMLAQQGAPAAPGGETLQLVSLTRTAQHALLNLL